jgi:hypothetical protein
VLGSHQISLGDFHFAFAGTFLLALIGVADFLPLSAQAGANVSGHQAKGVARNH